MRKEKFICEQIDPVQGTFDTAAMSAGAPGFPRRFIWRKKEYELAEVLETWKESGNCHHGSAEKYVRKHWHKIRTACGTIMTVYFDRQGRSKKERKSRWWLHTIIDETSRRWQLVGGLKLGPSAPGDYSFYGDLFSRLPKEVKHAGALTRFVAFDYLTAGHDTITFLGIEVDTIDAIPDGLMAWDINGSRLTVLAPGEFPSDTIRTSNVQHPTSNVEESALSLGTRHSRLDTRAASKRPPIVAWQADVNWVWRSDPRKATSFPAPSKTKKKPDNDDTRHLSPATCHVPLKKQKGTSESYRNRGLTGEFTVMIPAEWTGTGSSEERLFSMTANCYVAPGSEGANDTVELVDYDPQWPEQFTEFSHWLQDCLGDDVALRIEHFGSTAIPGMIAKPIIDVLVHVPSFAEAKQRAIPLFNKKDWEYWWYGDHPVFIKRNGFMGTRTHHVHMMIDGPELEKRLAFRDYLNAHPVDASRYAKLKQELAACHRQDREKYTDAKTAFVSKVSAQAMNQN